MTFRGNVFEAKVFDVIDGDTVDVDIDLGFDIWIKDRRIRLNNLDTPECRTRDLREKKYGLIAKARMEELLPVDTVVALKSYGIDKYGRVLGDIWLGEVGEEPSVVETMVAENLGVPYSGQNKKEIAAQHLANYALVDARLAKQAKKSTPAG